MSHKHDLMNGAPVPPDQVPPASESELTPIQAHTRAISIKARELLMTVTSGADLYEAGVPVLQAELVRFIEQNVTRQLVQVKLLDPAVLNGAPPAEQ